MGPKVGAIFLASVGAKLSSIIGLILHATPPKKKEKKKKKKKRKKKYGSSAGSVGQGSIVSSQQCNAMKPLGWQVGQ